MTKEQTNHELTKIRRGALTLNEYLRLSRVGETFTMNRTQRKAVYSLYLKECETNDNKRKAMLMNRPTEKGAYAYDAITRERDEVMLVTA